MTTNNNLNLYEYIREPDNPVCEQLIPSGVKDDFEIQMEEVLYNSLQEYQNCQKEMDEFEYNIKKEYEDECARRKLLFTDMFQIIKRVSAHDIKIKDVLEILEPIVEMYVEQIINSYEVDNESYNVIFKTLSLIRLKPVMIENLKSIITTN
jgi:sulfite reductase alpha subunit-like flavoprotein